MLFALINTVIVGLLDLLEKLTEYIGIKLYVLIV